MRAVRVVAPDQLTVEDVPLPILGQSSVLVRTTLASICGSDLHTVSGDSRGDTFPCPPGYPGHEAVGEVLESSSASFSPGDSVLVVPEPDGSAAFAEFQVVGEDFVIGLPGGSDLQAMLMAQQLGTVIFALKRMWPGPPGGVAAVLGAGSGGLHFTQLLKRRGFGSVIVADLSERRLRAAKELGADHTVLASEASILDAVMDLTGGEGADLVIEAAGHDETRAQAMRTVRVGGRIGLFGLPERAGDALYPYDVLFRRQPTIEIASGAQTEVGLSSFREALHDIETGRVVAADLVTHTYDIESIAEAVETARDRRDGALKVCLSFGDGLAG